MNESSKLPGTYDKEMIEMVKSNNLYTVEGLLTARQNFDREKHAIQARQKISKTAEKVFQNSKTDLIRSLIKTHGLSLVFISLLKKLEMFELSAIPNER